MWNRLIRPKRRMEDSKNLELRLKMRLESTVKKLRMPK